MAGKLYMIPTNIAECPADSSLALETQRVATGLKHFVVENIRTARRFLKSVSRDVDIDSLSFTELNEHTPEMSIASMLDVVEGGEDLGMMSEAGCPGVADPGALLAAEAHRRGIQVVPLVGPSSILMSLMASGLNGQNFTFRGYLPVGGELNKALRQMEERSQKEQQTQIFIEAPYRNNKMLETLVEVLKPTTRLTVARDVMGPEEMIVTHTVAGWRRKTKPDLHKRPTVFLFLA
jgi:16S rRNA (cytidine1402-2'-O)-methyltransferase